MPLGNRSRTIEFGRPSDWYVGTELLLVETLEGGSPQKPQLGLLRSWKLPNGEPEILGRVDWGKLGASETFFTPDGTGSSRRPARR
jgi:hypothetical protein